MDARGQEDSGDSAGERATLRCGVASLTEMTRRVPYHRRGGRAREDAR
ncbi:DUF6380 family protein [Streptomyces sp. NPDC056161]